ncbi:hypothetical protein TYRP_018083 [Tyrophagus putrescentiae]|nr:hypothetical protein TYRP_018083 [Tyrophagus putrescentiae]
MAKIGNGSGSRLTDDLLLIARLRARFPKAMRSLEAVVREFKALDTGSAHKDKDLDLDYSPNSIKNINQPAYQFTSNATTTTLTSTSNSSSSSSP